MIEKVHQDFFRDSTNRSITYARISKTTRILFVEQDATPSQDSMNQQSAASAVSGLEWLEQSLRPGQHQVFILQSASGAVEAVEKLLQEPVDCVLLEKGFSYAAKADMLLAARHEQAEYEVPVIELDYQADQVTARMFKAEAGDVIIKTHRDKLSKVLKDATRKKYVSGETPQLRIPYRDAQRIPQHREKQIYRLRQALEKSRALSRVQESELQKTLRHLSFEFENTPLVVIEWDREDRIRRWSREAENLFGWKAKEVLGKTFREFRFLAEEDSQTVVGLIRNLKEGLESKNVCENRNYHKNGQLIYCQWCNSVLYNEQREIESFISIVQDISQLKQKEQLLLESQERFRKLSQITLDGMAIHDQGIIVECNQRLSEMFGYPEERMIGTNGFLFFTTESLEIILDNVKRQSETPYEVTAIRHDGSLFPVEISGQPILYNNRELRLISLRDITERKRAENALRESEARFRSTFEQAAVGLLHTELDGNLIRANQKMCTISGYSLEELLSMNISDLLDRDAMENDRGMFLQVLRGEMENYVSEKRCLLKNGETHWINLNVSRVVDDQSGRAVYFVAVVEDISERKKAELQLQEVNAELDTFVYNASHDLRGPIASLLGLCNIARMDVTDSGALEYLQMIQKTAGHMNGVLLSLILMSQVKHHKAEPTRIDFNQLVAGTLQSLHSEEGFEEIDFQTEISYAADFHSDASLLGNILKNLLENAIRYRANASRCQPVVRIRVQPDTAGKGVQLTIQDNGIGIPAELHEKVFDMFFRATERSTGPGLGLYMVRKMAEKLGGTAQARPSLPGMTEICVRLPQMENLPA